MIEQITIAIIIKHNKDNIKLSLINSNVNNIYLKKIIIRKQFEEFTKLIYQILKTYLNN